MSDLVKRLNVRALARVSLKAPTSRDRMDADLDIEAADRIEALEAENAKLRLCLVNMLDDGDETDRKAARTALGFTNE